MPVPPSMGRSAMVSRTRPLTGSTRRTSCGLWKKEVTHRLPYPRAIANGSAFSGMRWTTWFVAGSMRASPSAWLSAAHTDRASPAMALGRSQRLLRSVSYMNECTELGPHPAATSCCGSPMRTVATTLLRAGSIRDTVPSASFGTQTAPAATKGGPTSRPTWNSAWTGRGGVVGAPPPQAAPIPIRTNVVTSFFINASYTYHSRSRSSTGNHGQAVAVIVSAGHAANPHEVDSGVRAHRHLFADSPTEKGPGEGAQSRDLVSS